MATAETQNIARLASIPAQPVVQKHLAPQYTADPVTPQQQILAMEAAVTTTIVNAREEDEEKPDTPDQNKKKKKKHKKEGEEESQADAENEDRPRLDVIA